MKKLIPPFFLFLLIGLSLNFIIPIKAEKTKIVNFSVIIDSASNFDALMSWLDTLNFSDFTFVLWENCEDDILNNATRLNKLKQYGEIIPRIAYIQQKTPSERLSYIDQKLAKYNNSLGYMPMGIFDFIPDTFSAQYVYDKGLIYYQGYCFDSWTIDFMSMRGGFQMPYYASDIHILIPSNQKSIVLLPHSTWDWISSFKYSQNIHLHPYNLIKRIFNDDVDKAKNYFLKLMDYTIMGSSPFGYAVFQFEWEWCYSEGITDNILDWINTTITTRPYSFWMFNKTAIWFRNTYTSTPTYRINFISPYLNERIEWYYDTESRIARIDNQVVSYVDYTEQNPDKFLTQNKLINWGIPSSDLNSIDISLKFKIDALGGASNRHPIKTDSYTYSGDLANFKTYYEVNKEMLKETFPQWVKIMLIFSILGLCVYFIKRSI